METNQQDNSIPSPTLLLEANVAPSKQPESHTEPSMTAMQNEGTTDMADVTTDDNHNEEVQNDVTRHGDKDLNNATFTFEVQPEAITRNADRLPNNSINVLEEISSDDQAHVAT